MSPTFLDYVLKRQVLKFTSHHSQNPGIKFHKIHKSLREILKSHVSRKLEMTSAILALYFDGE